MKKEATLQPEFAHVISKKEVMPGAFLLWLECPRIAGSSQPGQFVMAHCGEDTLLRRPISIHRTETNQGMLAILLSVVGKGTRWLSEREKGDFIDLLGPLGNSYTINPDAKNLLLIAGGIGIAPLCFLAQETVNTGHSVKLLHGASSSAQLYPRDLLPPGVELNVTTEDGSAGEKGMATDLLPALVAGTDQTFACGPLPMYRAMADLPCLKDQPLQVSLELRMACGTGICYGCTVKTQGGLKQVCQDGPVFDLKEVIWDKLTGGEEK
ncbi:dihydroorotate dehydrogenase electron transfer subunit [Chloroflexota bacterium]